jgi:hypothetical protein
VDDVEGGGTNLFHVGVRGAYVAQDLLQRAHEERCLFGSSGDIVSSVSGELWRRSKRAANRISGIVTISTRAAPARFRSMRVSPVEGSWEDFAVSCGDKSAGGKVGKREGGTNLLELDLVDPDFERLGLVVDFLADADDTAFR